MDDKEFKEYMDRWSKLTGSFIYRLSAEEIQEKLDSAKPYTTDLNAAWELFAKLPNECKRDVTMYIPDDPREAALKICQEYLYVRHVTGTIQIIVAEEGCISAAKIRDILRIGHGTFYSILRDIESVGLITIESDGDDKVISSTEKLAGYFAEAKRQNNEKPA